MASESELPQAPLIKPKLELNWKQRIGFPILLAIPIAALLGLFGERTALARAKTANLDVVVNYPERFRYRQVQPLHLSVRNRSAQLLDTVNIAFDTAYISRFSSVRFEPPVKKAYAVELTDVKPNETRFVSVELWGQDYGIHHGAITVRARSDSVIVRIRTFVFP